MDKTTTPPPTYPFTRLSARDPQMADHLRATCFALHRLGVTARFAARRLHVAGEDIALFTPATLYDFLAPEASGIAIEHEQAQRVQWVTLLRNVLVLLPLVFTWAGLSWATTEYQADLARSVADRTKPFLQLWQNGFGTQNTLFTFSHFALVDVGLFSLLIIVGLIADIVERRARKQGYDGAIQLQTAVQRLSEVTLPLIRGVSESTSPVEWATQVNQIVQDIAVLVRRVGQLVSETAEQQSALTSTIAHLDAPLTKIATAAERLSLEERSGTSVSQDGQQS